MGFLSLMESIGPWAVSVVLIVVFILLVQRINEKMGEVADKVDKSQKAFETAMDGLGERLETLEKRVAADERDYAEKSYVQENFGAWRTELRQLGDRIDKLLLCWGGKDK